ncbi:hypothetical protein LINPERPRIM_LOCUS44197 [Linum perenne]
MASNRMISLMRMRWSSKQLQTTSTKRCLTTSSSSSSSGNGSGRAPYNKYSLTGEYAPVYIVMGFVSVAVGIGIHSLKQQLLHSPGVSLKKTRRGSMSEADDPNLATANAHNFLNKSFLRKIARLQDKN